MSKAELLLNKLDASRVATRLANASEEPHLIIGDDRIINVPDELKRLAQIRWEDSHLEFKDPRAAFIKECGKSYL